MAPPSTTTCFICHEETLGASVPLLNCSVCLRRCHKKCARLLLGNADDLPLLPPDNWICRDCESCRTSSVTPLLGDSHFQAIMNQLATLTQVITACDKKIEDLNNTVLAQSLAITNCSNDIAALQTENECLKRRLDILETRGVDMSGLSVEEIFAESTDRLRRKNNILLLGIPESSREDNETFVNNLLSSVSPRCINFITSAARLGRGRGSQQRPRPYRITFQNPEQAVDVLKKKDNLCRSTYPNVKIVSDMTPKQILYLNNLRKELQLRQESEENLTIKYVNGTPTITCVLSDGSKRPREEDISPRRDPGVKISKPCTFQKN